MPESRSAWPNLDVRMLGPRLVEAPAKTSTSSCADVGVKDGREGTHHSKDEKPWERIEECSVVQHRQLQELLETSILREGPDEPDPQEGPSECKAPF